MNSISTTSYISTSLPSSQTRSLPGTACSVIQLLDITRTHSPVSLSIPAIQYPARLSDFVKIMISFFIRNPPLIFYHKLIIFVL